MARKALQFFLRLRKMTLGPNKGQEMLTAVPTHRERITFREFCHRTAKNTTFSEREVAAVINEAVTTAREIVTDGDTVEFGDLGTLMPSFKSKMVPKDKPFVTNAHITKPVVRLLPNRKYFELDDVSFEQVVPPAPKPPKLPKTPKP